MTGEGLPEREPGTGLGLFLLSAFDEWEPPTPDLLERVVSGLTSKWGDNR
ncbi:hypothetical protein NG2371_00717 [Nocardia gamkensis]|nr:hypothetical protein [Nocardia gamkensis]